MERLDNVLDFKPPAKATLPTLPEPKWPRAWTERHARRELRKDGRTCIATPGAKWLRCPRCQGSGWEPTTYTRHETIYEGVKACKCEGIRRRASKYTAARLPAKWLSIHGKDNGTPGETEWEGVSPELRAIVRRFRGDYQRGGRSVLLSGPTGTGKTHFAALMLTYATLRHAAHARWAHWPELLRTTREAINDRSIPDPMTGATAMGLLVVDDLGAGRTTPWSAGEAERLGERCESGLTTIVTTNLSLDELAKTYGARLDSRLRRACDVVDLRGRDRRL